ncbi:MAG: glutamine-hydrolyzing GMP synthase, partial [Candidatus Omnitrophica bacterium]|nr:glutamine-hydrolyzing GMP synthase [Candidatus Omnitrophota bacterium]
MKTQDTIVILDFGSQYTQLIARRIRENHVFSKILPYNIPAKEIKSIAPKGIILSGGPASVSQKGSPLPDKNIFKLGIPILGICYGMQVIAKCFGGRVKPAKQREYGRTEVFIDDLQNLFYQLPGNLTCWMSHGDYVNKVPKGFKVIAHTLNNIIAGIALPQRRIYAVQFHPEVTHTSKGNQIIANFLFRICGAYPSWTMQSFIK